MSGPGPTSVRSERVGAVRRLANGSFRRKVGRFLIEGPQAVREAVRCHPAALDEVFVDEAAGGAAAEIAAEARGAGVRTTVVPEPVLLAMTETVHPQGIAAVGCFLDRPVTDLVTGARTAVLLDRVRDPGNAGTILRTADAAGADCVIFSPGSVDPYNGKCVRATAGSLFHIPFAIADPGEDVIGLAKRAGMQVLVATGSGDTAITDVDLRRDTLWVFGNEAHGVSADSAAAADHRVVIPMTGRAESLNLAGAAAICLFAAALRGQAPG